MRTAKQFISSGLSPPKPQRVCSDKAGDFLSKETACYPSALAQAFAASVTPLLSAHTGDIPWDQRMNVLPVKAPDAFPRSQEDGGGLFSQPDWSQSGRKIPDTFASLRKSWLDRIISKRLDKKLVAFCQLESPGPPFSEDEDGVMVKSRRALIRCPSLNLSGLEGTPTVRPQTPRQMPAPRKRRRLTTQQPFGNF